MRDSQSARWVLIVWAALAAGLVIGLGLWIVHGVLRGVPGPVVAGVYLDGAGDVAVVAVCMVSATALATVSAVMVLYFLHSPGDPQMDLANWLGSWTFVLFVPTGLVLMVFPSGSLPSRRWWILPWLAIVGTAAGLDWRPLGPESASRMNCPTHMPTMRSKPSPRL